MHEDDWHGWSVRGKSVYVGRLPGRKQVCFYVQDGGVIRTLAFFRTEEMAREALALLDALVSA